MSNKIVNEIRKLPIASTPKQVLWVLADIADDNGETGYYAPTMRLMEETGLSNKTISECISYLKECGILSVTGGRGRQNHHKINAENFNPLVKYEPKKQSKVVSEVHQSSSELGSSRQCTRFTTPVNLAQKVVSEVHTIPHIHQYPSVYPSLGDSENPPKVKPELKVKRVTKKQAGIIKLVELGCDEKYASDWMIARKGAELTDSIIENLSEQSAKANITIAQAVEWSAKKGYQGFKADWYLKDKHVQQPRYQNTNNPNNPNADYWAKFGNQQNQEWYDPIDVTPKKPIRIEGVGHA